MTGLLVAVLLLSVLSWAALWFGMAAHHRVLEQVAAMPDETLLQPDTWPVDGDDSTAKPYSRGAAPSARFLSGRR